MWKKELELAGKREKEWFTEAEKVLKRYRGEEKKKNRFNVLWSNTETLRPAIYNSRPAPDVRRRFRDADPIGKAVSELLERALMVVVDYECTDVSLKNDTLDGLLVGRGLSRIRYIPSIKQVAPPQPPKMDAQEDALEEEEQEEVEYEQVVPEHVDWKDYREGYARTWDEMPHIFFRHRLTRPDAVKKFGKDKLADVKFALPGQENPRQSDEEQNETQKVAEFWEIWDKVGQKVFFIQEECKELLFPLDNPDGSPPLQFSGFFPIPEPMKIIENTNSMIPVIPFTLYREQADQLDKISVRIDAITNAMRLRGMYDAKLTELSGLMEKDDNELMPVNGASNWADKGLDAAIAWFPTEKAAQLLESLYEARAQQKAIIDELVGISDIIRGATDPDETLGAQELKQNNYSVRLSRMQKEVQRYARDLLRLGAEVIATKFAPETLTEMTELQFPTQQQKMQAQMQAQSQAAQLPPGSPPPPPNPILQMPTWEDILGVMRSNGLRKFKIDVETDSTIAATLNNDMAGLSLVLKAIGETLQGAAPLVQSGSLPVDAVKELVMAVVRRAKMGMAVEDAFEKLKAPNPPGPPKEVLVAQVKAQSDKEIAAQKAQQDAQQAQIEQQAQAQDRQAESQVELQKAQRLAEIELQKDSQAKAHEAQLKQIEGDIHLRELSMQLENERLIADANNQTKIQVAEIAAGAQLAKQASQQSADAQSQASEQAADAKSQDKDIKAQGEQQDKEIEAQEAPKAADYQAAESQVLPIMKELLEHIKRPKRLMRDERGSIVGLQ